MMDPKSNVGDWVTMGASMLGGGALVGFVNALRGRKKDVSDTQADLIDKLIARNDTLVERIDKLEEGQRALREELAQERAENRALRAQLTEMQQCLAQPSPPPK